MTQANTHIFSENTQITDPYSFCLYIFSIGESISHEKDED